FNCITNNAVASAASAPQYHVEVTDAGGGLVNFRFTNDLSIQNPSSITQIYFDDGTLLGIAHIFETAGVDYSQGGSPQNLPGGNGVNFHTSQDFLITPNPPTFFNGVDQTSESVTVQFSLINGKTFNDTINAINLALANPGVDMDGGLRIGIHVQGFQNGQS